MLKIISHLKFKSDEKIYNLFIKWYFIFIKIIEIKHNFIYQKKTMA